MKPSNKLRHHCHEQVTTQILQYNLKQHTSVLLRDYSGDLIEMLLLMMMVMALDGVEPPKDDSGSVFLLQTSPVEFYLSISFFLISVSALSEIKS
jgi:hypothetical protein